MRLSAVTAAFVLGAAVAMSTVPADASETLFAAAERGDVAALRQTLAGGAKLEATDDHGRSALLIAAYGNRLEAIRLLVEAGADIRRTDGLKNDLLSVAAVSGQLEIVRLAIARGASLTPINRYGGIPIIPAAHYGHVEVVRELIKAGSPLDHVNSLGWTALIEAVILGDGGPRHTRIVERLLTAGASARIGDRDGATPLALATQRGFRAMQALLEQAVR